MSEVESLKSEGLFLFQHNTEHFNAFTKNSAAMHTGRHDEGNEPVDASNLPGPLHFEPNSHVAEDDGSLYKDAVNGSKLNPIIAVSDSDPDGQDGQDHGNHFFDGSDGGNDGVDDFDSPSVDMKPLIESSDGNLESEAEESNISGQIPLPALASVSETSGTVAADQDADPKITATTISLKEYLDSLQEEMYASSGQRPSCLKRKRSEVDSSEVAWRGDPGEPDVAAGPRSPSWEYERGDGCEASSSRSESSYFGINPPTPLPVPSPYTPPGKAEADSSH